jgi:hypothetical protein
MELPDGQEKLNFPGRNGQWQNCLPQTATTAVHTQFVLPETIPVKKNSTKKLKRN